MLDITELNPFFRANNPFLMSTAKITEDSYFGTQQLKCETR